MYLRADLANGFRFERDNSLLKNLAFRCLWVAKVHHFVQQLVYDNEVVPDRLFLHFLEVFSQDLSRAFCQNDGDRFRSE